MPALHKNIDLGKIQAEGGEWIHYPGIWNRRQGSPFNSSDHNWPLVKYLSLDWPSGSAWYHPKVIYNQPCGKINFRGKRPPCNVGWSWQDVGPRSLTAPPGGAGMNHCPPTGTSRCCGVTVDDCHPQVWMWTLGNVPCNKSPREGQSLRVRWPPHTRWMVIDWL